jgi:protoporphyrinogen oxidase
MVAKDNFPNEPVAIIGGGLAGLSAAYDLGKKGFQVILLESGPEIGGLASSFKIGGAPIERFYHFICRADSHLVNLAEELGIGAALHWQQAGTGYFHNGQMYSFGTPFDLIRFAPIPFFQRLRFGLNILQSRFLNDWHSLDDLSARDWLENTIGREAYQVIWDPLLRVKFGEHADKISAAWIWHRVWRVASSRRRLWERDQLGYLEQGSSTIVNALAQKIKTYPTVKVFTNARVVKIDNSEGSVRGIQLHDGSYLNCKWAISTMPLPLFMQVASDLPKDYVSRLSQIEYIGVICMMLRLRRSLTDFFWVNINDPQVSFNGFIEYTNLNPRPDLNGSHIVYVPFYIATSNERFHRDNESLLNEYVAALQRVNPNFKSDWIEEYFVFRENYAQAICHTGFSRFVPPHTTPIRNLYITDSVQFYPEDRTISAAIRLGRHVAQMVTDGTKQSASA